MTCAMTTYDGMYPYTHLLFLSIISSLNKSCTPFLLRYIHIHIYTYVQIISGGGNDLLASEQNISLLQTNLYRLFFNKTQQLGSMQFVATP